MAEPDSNRPMVFVAHSVPSRTRLRIPDRRHQPDYFAQLSQRLSAHPRVRQVEVNAGTGSVLLRHDGAIAPILEELGDVLRLVRDAPPPVRRPAPRAVRSVPVSAFQLAALGCVALGAWQLRRGRLLGTASESVWQAYNAWRYLRAPGVAAALLGGGMVQLARGQVLSPAVSLLFYAMNLRQSRRPPAASAP